MLVPASTMTMAETMMAMIMVTPSSPRILFSILFLQLARRHGRTGIAGADVANGHGFLDHHVLGLNVAGLRIHLERHVQRPSPRRRRGEARVSRVEGEGCGRVHDVLGHRAKSRRRTWTARRPAPPEQVATRHAVLDTEGVSTV